MFCRKCDTKIEEVAKFCPKCGTKVGAMPQVQPAPGSAQKYKWICSVCGYVYIDETPPINCPVCKAPAAKFKSDHTPNQAQTQAVSEQVR